MPTQSENHERHVELFDTTLRDGEQTPGLSYAPAEKLTLARLLLERVGVNRIEIASAGASEGEREAVRRVVDWARGAGVLDRVELLGFCDAGRSARWMAEVGATNMNLLTKGSERHCRLQLRQTPAEHLAAITSSIEAARASGVRTTGVYLEDWSQGVVDSPAYVMNLTEALLRLGVARIFLADTLGCLSPEGVRRHVGTMRQAFPEAWFEFHGHDDYGLATANALAAADAGVRGLHATVNGLGERAGNANLAEVVVALHDHASLCTTVVEAALYEAALMVERLSGKPLRESAPIVGSNAFTQTAGVHADGDRKGELYASRLSAGRFGRVRAYALGKLSGRASVAQNLDLLGISLDDEECDRLLARIVELGDQKRSVLTSDLPLLIDDVLGAGEGPQVIRDYVVTVSKDSVAEASVELELAGRRIRTSRNGIGGYQALMSAIAEAAASLGLTLPPLEDFRVRIAPGGGTEALVETTIVFGTAPRVLVTRGAAPDQTAAAVAATEKMLQLLVAGARETARLDLA